MSTPDRSAQELMDSLRSALTLEIIVAEKRGMERAALIADRFAEAAHKTCRGSMKEQAYAAERLADQIRGHAERDA